MSYKMGERLYYIEGAKVYEAEIDDIVRYYNNGDIDTRYKIRYKDKRYGNLAHEVRESEIYRDYKDLYEKKFRGLEGWVKSIQNRHKGDKR